MNFFSKLERKFGKYAISNLPLYLILCYVCGYVIQAIVPTFSKYLTLEPYLILHGQIWRIFTWILVIPRGIDLFSLIIMMLFYYSIGTSLERVWGSFLYNIYILGGMLFTVAGVFFIYGFYYIFGREIILFEDTINTLYVNLSIFLGFAATFPESQVYLMFILPIKVKWMGIAYAVILLVNFVKGGFADKVIIISSLLNFIVFFLLTRRGLGMRISPKQVKRRHDF